MQFACVARVSADISSDPGGHQPPMMYSEAHYTVPNSHYLPHHSASASPTLTSSANILNYDPSSPLAASSSDQQMHGNAVTSEFPEYKREPGTPTNTMANMEYPGYPSAFTPSPSLSGSESPRTPNSYYTPSASGGVYPPTSLETGGERLTVPFPAPTPPLSANTHLAKEPQHSLPDTEAAVQFSNEQIDCICDTLQQRKDMNTLGE